MRVVEIACPLVSAVYLLVGFLPMPEWFAASGCVSRRHGCNGAAAPASPPLETVAVESESEPQCHLQALPLHVLLLVLQRLPLRCLARVACSSRVLRDAARSPSLYTRLKLSELGTTPLTASLLLQLCEAARWRVETLDACGRLDADGASLAAATLVCSASLVELRAMECGWRGRGLSLLQLRRIADGCPRLRLCEADAVLPPSPPSAWDELRWALTGGVLRLRTLHVGCHPTPLSSSQLAALPAALAASRHADGPVALCLSRQPALSAHLEALLAAVGARTALTSLSLDYCGLIDIEDSGRVAAALRRGGALSRLTGLSLRGSGLGRHAALQLGDALAGGALTSLVRCPAPSGISPLV